MFSIKREKRISDHDFEVENGLEAPLDQPDGPSGFKIQCEWFKAKNARNHRTNEYENDTIVLRRGETFDLELRFEGVEFSEIKNTTLTFSVDINSEGMKSIQSNCSIVDKIDKTKWCMEIVESNKTSLRMLLKVNIPANTIIGRYSVDVHLPSSTESLKTSKLIVIFNPWCKDDEVYLDNEEQRNEYVLNETGIMYQGTIHYGPYEISKKLWNFGQFEKDILDCVLLLLEKDKRSERNPLKALAKRSSALWVSRILSALVNSQDDRGVLIGNWSGAYDGGVAPSSWNGSVAILQQYYHTEQPVRYGQCWVYAGVLTTVLRVLGIPVRAVTNFKSAHDTDVSMTIDDFYDENGHEIHYLSLDSIWNFHVWNEMWCRRNDLPGRKYDGWQVVDATPQERSFGLFQLGPAPVKAVKDGEIYAGLDTGFVFAEVNADYVRWTMTTDEDGLQLGQQLDYTNKTYIGQYISTKMVGRNEREDVTRHYKYPEGSVEERKSVATAYSFGAGALRWTGHFNVEHEGKDLALDVKGEPAGIIDNGKNITGLIDVNNISQKHMTVNVTTVLNSIIYTGEVKHLVAQKKFENVSIDVGQSAHFEVPVESLDYIKKLTDLNTMRMVVVVKVLETNKLYVDTFDFQLENKDRIKVQLVDDELKVGQSSEVNVKFHNNLPISLNNLTVTIEGAGLTRPLIEQHSELGSDETMTKTFSITPYKTGNRTLIVDVDSNEVKDFKSYVTVNVLEPDNVHV